MNTINTSVIKSGIITLSALLLFGCGADNSEGTQGTSDSIAVKDSIAHQSNENAFYSIPSPIQLGQMLQRAGATYDKKVLNSNDNASKYTSVNSKALNLGVYGADLSYSAVFNQSQETMSYLASSKKLAEELGITTTFSAEMMKRMEKNTGNKDSLLQIISELFLSSNEALKENDQSNISVLVMAGGFIEGMYVGTQVAKTVKDNTAIYARIGEFRGSLKNLIMLVSTVEGSDFSEVLADLKSIKAVYDETPVADEKATTSIDTTKKVMTIGGKKNYTLTKEQIEKITTLVQTIRTKMIKP
jgi:hypothetical protein